MISNKESLGEHSEKIWGGGESGKSADGLWGSLWANIAVSRALDGQLWDETLEEAPEMTFSHSLLSSRALGKFWPHLPFLASKSI